MFFCWHVVKWEHLSCHLKKKTAISLPRKCPSYQNLPEKHFLAITFTQKEQKQIVLNSNLRCVNTFFVYYTFLGIKNQKDKSCFCLTLVPQVAEIHKTVNNVSSYKLKDLVLRKIMSYI